ncbi:hypothetical protein ACQPZ2_19200 [Nocardia pseudovaccinii]|uniref:WXG100 family type VII secretion target n=1 Tax=Nocardia pseudovaccinii TaxID=189540 RepID=UPI003D92C2A4
MNSAVRLDPDSLRNRGARLAALGDRVGQTYAGLRDCLAQSEGSWGDDDIGLAFAKEFEPHAEQLLANVLAIAESLHGTAAGIIDAASQFEAQDAYLASRVSTAAANVDPNIAEPTQRPDGAGGTPALAGPHSPVTYDPAATAPAAGGQPYLTDRMQPTERSAPGGPRSPDAATARSRPQDGPLRPNSSDRMGEGSNRAGREDSGTPGNRAGQSGRRPSPSPGSPAPSPGSPPSSSVLPPAATRNGARLPVTASGARPAVDVGRRDTPWTGQRPPTPGSPASAQPSSPSPRYGSPPRSNKPADEPQRERDRRGPAGRSVSDPMVGWLARRLAENHGVRVAGFDTPGLQVSPVRAFVAAVDRVLTDYPVIALDIVAVAELGTESGMVRWSSEPRDSRGTARSITLDQRTAQEAESDAEPGIYAATLREFGRALDGAGGGLAGRQAQRVLIAEYLRLEPARHRTLADVVRGYQHWRAELAGDATTAGGFDANRALGAAFADVVQRGDAAGIPAKTLHAVLVAAASRRG